MDKNHCAKCIHLKKNKEGKKISGGTTFYGIFPGMYVCDVGVDSGLLVQSLILIYVSISQKTNLK